MATPSCTAAMWKKRLLLPAVEFGASLWTRRFQTSFSYVILDSEFYGQNDREDYGSVLFSYFFQR
jgi:hypothetical protein